MNQGRQIIIGSDHAGYDQKEHLKSFLGTLNIPVEDLGIHAAEPADYPEIAVDVAKAVAEKKEATGILVCGSGIGMSIVANKISGIRAALCMNEEMARLSRMHNNANVLVLAGRMIQFPVAEAIVRTFLNTTFESGTRHERRVKKIHALTQR